MLYHYFFILFKLSHLQVFLSHLHAIFLVFKYLRVIFSLLYNIYQLNLHVMTYMIKSVISNYADNDIILVLVLWDDNGLHRATYMTSEDIRTSGFPLFRHALLSDVVQHVASHGTYLSDAMKKEYFSSIQSWSR